MLDEILQLNIFHFFLVFSRIGTAMMLLPGIGGQLVGVRSRLWLTFAICFVVLPVLSPHLPATPTTPGAVLAIVFSETVVGLFMGVVVALLMSTLTLAGSMIGYQTGLTNAFSFDPISQQQSQLLTGFLSNVGMLAVFSTDLHHLMLTALVESYGVFHPGHSVAFGEMAESLSHVLTDTFRLGLQFAMPLLVFGLVFYAGLGVLSRLAPMLQVFFIAMPIQVLMGMWMFMVTLPVIVSLFLRFFEGGLIPYLTPR